MKLYIAWMDVEVCCHLDPPAGVFTSREKAVAALRRAKAPCAAVVEVEADRLTVKPESAWPKEKDRVR